MFITEAGRLKQSPASRSLPDNELWALLSQPVPLLVSRSFVPPLPSISAGLWVFSFLSDKSMWPFWEMRASASFFYSWRMPYCYFFHLYISFSVENSTYEILTYLLFMLLSLSCIWARTINSTNIFDCYLEIVGWLHRVAWIHHESLQLKGARGKRKLLLGNILSNEL